MNDDFLMPTRYCDIGSKEINDFVKELGYRPKIETVSTIFNFVRDRIKYRFDYPSTTASKTLTKKAGTCFNKANLEIALLRKAGIPAGYGIYLVRKEILKLILPEDIFSMVNDPTVHVFAKVFMGSKWIGLDATVDIELFNCFYQDSDIWTHDPWDGKTDILLKEDFVVEDQGLYANIDLYLSQPPRLWTDSLIEKVNAFIEDKIKQKKIRNDRQDN
ncbi:MAG: transglutaminase family protein [Candidatus Omnitrophica bacterium]|nr:transglutaminase family protein [Candidatus Omnitrophota bacterium]MCM8788780.1 transglutaminase family protein [Candidatus Omnitrophota bacterium]